MSAQLGDDGNTYMFPPAAGGPCYQGPGHEGCTLHTCAKCHIHTEVTFLADSRSHHVSDRSGNQLLPHRPPHRRDVALCVHCWSDLLKEDW